MLFVIFPDAAGCKAYSDDLRRRAAAAGRPPDAVKVAPAVYVIVGDSAAEAAEKLAFIDSLARPVDSLALLSEVFNYDFSRHPPGEPISDAAMASMTGLRGFLDRVIRLSGNANPTVDDFVRWSGRGTLRELPVFSGTAAQVADEMESWFGSEACDGFVLAATHIPGAYEDFARLVTPELQRRGLFRREYAAGTLRDNLGAAAAGAGAGLDGGRVGEQPGGVLDGLPQPRIIERRFGKVGSALGPRYIVQHRGDKFRERIFHRQLQIQQQIGFGFQVLRGIPRAELLGHIAPLNQCRELAIAISS